MRGAGWVLLGTFVAGGCRGSEACADLGDEVLLTAQVTDNGQQTRGEVELRRGELGGKSIPVKLCEHDALWVDAVEMPQVKRPRGAVHTSHEIGNLPRRLRSDHCRHERP